MASSYDKLAIISGARKEKQCIGGRASHAEILNSAREGIRKEGARLCVVRIDYNYERTPGDIDSEESFDYRVRYRMVSGLTFEKCKKNEMTEEVRDEFINVIKLLDSEDKVSVITSDCGFMMWFQNLCK